jgi:gas vesicle protein
MPASIGMIADIKLSLPGGKYRLAGFAGNSSRGITYILIKERLNMRNSNPREETTSTQGIGNGLLYLLIGGGIGATLGLLFAPKSGSDLRSDISDYTRQGCDQTLELAGKLKEQSSGLYNSMRGKEEDVLDLASTTSQQGSSEGQSQAENSPVNGELQNDGGTQNYKSVGSGGRSSDIF